LFGVGNNLYGCAVGDGERYDCLTIKQIDYFKDIFIVDVCCGTHHCLAISKNGDVFGWGENRCGQIGNGKSGDYEFQLTPIKVFKI
jgi:alpha-tubulin suppressor-like RCC1 family protein